MDATRYQELAARTLIDKPDFTLTADEQRILLAVLKLSALAGETVELCKKGILHQHGFDFVAYGKAMTAIKIHVQLMAFYPENLPCHIPDDKIMIIWNALGLSGEAGEVAEVVYGAIEKSEPLDLRKEIGDCAWYTAALCTKLDYDLSDVLAQNIAKLKLRYPDGYNSADSQLRADVVDAEIEAKIDQMSDEATDTTLRRLGYSPVQVGLHGRVIAEICLENVRLRNLVAAAYAVPADAIGKDWLDSNPVKSDFMPDDDLYKNGRGEDL